MTTVKVLLQEAKKSIPLLEAELLIAKVLEYNGREEVFLHLDEPITSKQKGLSLALVERRKKHEPMAYILGVKEFWSLEFIVNKNVLIPRPETELLIEETLARYPDTTQPLRFLDLGTGSGCILLSLLHEYKNAVGVGVDISTGALSVAELNAKALGLSARAHFYVSDWFSSIPENEKFDVILCNPPYIKVDDIEDLQEDVRDYEPQNALTDGGDGLQHYRIIADKIVEYMKPNGLALFECGVGQMEDICAILRENRELQGIMAEKDLSGKWRCVKVEAI